MIDWLRFLLMIFYNPLRGMRAMRDRGSLAPVVLLAFITQIAYGFVTKRFAGVPGAAVFSEIFQAGRILAVIAIVVVPILTLIANMFERRGSFRVVITQEYASLAASVFYVLSAANIFAILVATLLHYTGLQAQHVAVMIQHADQTREMLGPQFDEVAQQLTDPVILSYRLFSMFEVAFACIGAVFAVKDSFRMSVARALAVTAIGLIASFFVAPIVY